jgi:hypothetical protein
MVTVGLQGGRVEGGEFKVVFLAGIEVFGGGVEFGVAGAVVVGERVVVLFVGVQVQLQLLENTVSFLHVLLVPPSETFVVLEC